MDTNRYQKNIDAVVAFLRVLTASRTLTPDQMEDVVCLITELEKLKRFRNDKRLRSLVSRIARQFLRSDSRRIEV